MFAGHIGAALAVGSAERNVNVGVFIVAALLLDFLLWFFVLLGWESVIIPDDFSNTHQAEFVFPYSHGLVASVVWSALAGMLGFGLYSCLQKTWRVPALVAVAVFSHWVLDALVRRRELPLAGSASHAVGLGLWNDIPLALSVETAIVVVGLCLFVSGTKLARSKSIALVVLCLVVTAFTAVGMTIAPAPPSARVMAASSLGTLALVCGLAYWLGRPPQQAEADR